MNSFGRPDREEQARDADAVQPVPVLHVGEVHADLRLHITDDTLRELGEQLGSLIAAAVRQGFDAGLSEAMTAASDEALGDLTGRTF